jgi:type IV pilus assembly protein PilA
MKKRKGFTLMELIIVIAIIAILAGVVYVAIDPARRLNEARNARRASDVVAILDAVRKHQADNDGQFYSTILSAAQDVNYVIGTNVSGCSGTCGSVTVDDECVDLSSIGDNYLAVIPLDPKSGTDANTGYYFNRSSGGAFTVGSCHAEGEDGGGSGTPPVIKVVR